VVQRGCQRERSSIQWVPVVVAAGDADTFNDFGWVLQGGWRFAPNTEAFARYEGINISKRHTKPRQSSGATDRTPKIQQGGILDLAQPLAIGKVMLVCSHCGKPTRIAHKQLENGRRVRICRHCGEQLEVKS
jgi:ribosomal protein L24